MARRSQQISGKTKYIVKYKYTVMIKCPFRTHKTSTFSRLEAPEDRYSNAELTKVIDIMHVCQQILNTEQRKAKATSVFQLVSAFITQMTLRIIYLTAMTVNFESEPAGTFVTAIWGQRITKLCAAAGAKANTKRCTS